MRNINGRDDRTVRTSQRCVPETDIMFGEQIVSDQRMAFPIIKTIAADVCGLSLIIPDGSGIRPRVSVAYFLTLFLTYKKKAVPSHGVTARLLE